MRNVFWMVSATLFLTVFALGWIWPFAYGALIVLIPLFALGVADICQTKHTIRRNFPVIGHGRYIMESIRPEINQYFVESNRDGVPFDRERRSIIYQRAKKQLDTLPFGTQGDVYAQDYEWINHSLAPKPVPHEPPRVLVGGPDCKQPYSAALLNVSAMSYGSLSMNAILALNQGAKSGGFYHNTGEGGISPHHLAPGGDLVWQIGTGYFGCRGPDGSFSDEQFKKRALLPNVKMIEIKLSQGAKPGHGGILPASKLTQEIIDIRGVQPGKDVISPPAHTAFSTPEEMMHFIARLRKLSEGKPIGFKLCIGKRREFMAICKAMLKTGIYPDFITVDGGEGGTGAAPVEFSNSVGTPLKEGLVYVHNTLVGCGIRDRIKVIAAGKVTTGFHMVTLMALGADLCNSARAMLFALGCIQALKCNSNHCPTGVATQDPELVKGLHVPTKAVRVTNFQRETVHSMLEVVGATGLSNPNELRPWHIMRRTTPTEVRNYDEIYGFLKPGALLGDKLPAAYERAWVAAKPESFA
jgi:glutamate synthase domain-containing protein 2